MALCTPEYQRLNAKLNEVIDYKHSFLQYVEINRAAQLEAIAADEEINRIRGKINELKEKAHAAEELARKVGEEAAKIAQAKQEVAEVAEAAKAAAAEALSTFPQLDALIANPIGKSQKLISNIKTALKNVTDKLVIVEYVKGKFNQLTGCEESGTVGGGKVKKSRKNKKSKNTRKNKKSKNTRKNSRKNRKN